MICGHDAAALPENDLIGRLFPDLSPAMVKTVLSRASYQSEQEREAELLASLILTRPRRAAAVMPVLDISEAEARILRRAGLALGMDP